MPNQKLILLKMKTFENWFETFDKNLDIDLNKLKVVAREAFDAGKSSIWSDAKEYAPMPQNDKSLHSMIVISEKGEPVYYNFFSKEWYMVEIDNFFKVNLIPTTVEKWCWTTTF